MLLSKAQAKSWQISDNWIFFMDLILQRNTIYARVDSALHRIRDTSEVISFIIQPSLPSWILYLQTWYLCQAVQAFAAEHLKTPLGEPVKGRKNKSSTELWLEKFYKKKTNLPEPFPHELVERLEKYLDVSLFFSYKYSDQF